MRKKIKQLMNKEEGFTLVELLAVIVILGIILAIAIPSVGGVINRAQDNADAAEQGLIIDAARIYFTAGKDSAGNDISEDLSVEVSELETTGFLEDRGDGGIEQGTVSRERDTNGTYKNYSFDE